MKIWIAQLSVTIQDDMIFWNNIPFPLFFRDEHSLIAQYCQKLHNGDINSLVPDSPLQLMAELDDEKRQQLELMIRYA